LKLCGFFKRDLSQGAKITDVSTCINLKDGASILLTLALLMPDQLQTLSATLQGKT
jgi:hypothetical protein